MKKDGSLKSILIISSIIGGILILLSLIGLIFNQTGWVIGAAIGTLVGLANSLLSVSSSDLILKSQKPGMFLLSYFLRMFLFVAFFAMLVIFQYKLSYEPFKYSFIGMIISYMPSTFIVIALQLRAKKDEK